MSLVTKVVFPIPPPTTNDLSSHQRTQLLRKAKKLEQIFGVTPRLLDSTLEPSDPIHIAFPRRPSHHRQTKTSRESINSSSSTSSCETPSPRRRSPPTDSESCNSPFIRGDNSRASSTSSVNLINSTEASPRRSKGPVMRLFMKAPTREIIPASPSPAEKSHKTSYSISPHHSPNLDVLFGIPVEEPSLRNPTTPNSYNITSLSSLRKQKMDRLRRKLGQDVPFDLVFPSSDSESERSVTPIPPAVKECSVLLPPLIPRLRKDTGRLSSARDSIVGCSSVHRAKRQSVTKQTLTPAPTDLESSESKRLSFIIESPDEHGVGCAEEFGQPLELDQAVEFRSEWTVSAGTEVKLWSTRRGYEGWRPNPSSIASQSPSTMSHSVPPPLPITVPSNNTELKKKPPSYRKPVPRLLELE